jgi:hypothetical protein
VVRRNQAQRGSRGSNHWTGGCHVAIGPARREYPGCGSNYRFAIWWEWERQLSSLVVRRSGILEVAVAVLVNRHHHLKHERDNYTTWLEDVITVMTCLVPRTSAVMLDVGPARSQGMAGLALRRCCYLVDCAPVVPSPHLLDFGSCPSWSPYSALAQLASISTRSSLLIPSLRAQASGAVACISTSLTGHSGVVTSRDERSAQPLLRTHQHALTRTRHGRRNFLTHRPDYSVIIYSIFDSCDGV